MSDLRAANEASIRQWVGMAGRLDLLGLREMERELRRGWSEESLAPVLEAIAQRRAELSEAREYPTCAQCGKPCDKPFGWFAIERWESGRVVRRGFACGAGCLLAVAHSQRDRPGDVVALTKGELQPVDEQ